MSKSKIVAIVAGVLVALGAVAAGGYFFVEQRIRGQIEEGLRSLSANPPAAYRSFAYDKVEFSLRHRRAVVAGVKAERANGDALGIATVELENFDAEAWQKSISGASDITFRRIFDQAVLTKLSATDGGRPITVERVSLSALELRPLPANGIDAFRQMPVVEAFKTALALLRVESVVLEGFKGVSSGRDLSFARGELVGLRDERFKSLTFDRLEHDQVDGKMSIGRLELQGGVSAVWFSPTETKSAADKLAYLDFSALKLVGLRKEDATDKESGVTIAAIEFGPVDNKKLTTLQVRDFTVAHRKRPEPVKATIGTIELRDVDWEQVLPLLVTAAERSDSNAAGDALRGQLERIGRARYSVGKLSLAGMAFAPGVTLAQLNMRGTNDAGTGEGDLTINDFMVKAAELTDKSSGAALTAFGYSTLTLSMRMRAVSDAKPGTAGLETMEIFGPQVGRLTAKYGVSNYKEAPAGASDPMAQLLAASIDHAEIGWQDDGLTQRALAFGARQQRTSMTQLKAGLSAQLRQIMAPYRNSPRVTELGEALLRYLDKPGTLTISVKPKQPVPVLDLVKLVDVPVGQEPDLPALFELLEIRTTVR